MKWFFTWLYSHESKSRLSYSFMWYLGEAILWVWTRILQRIFQEVTLNCQANRIAKIMQQEASIWCEILAETYNKRHLVSALTSVLYSCYLEIFTLLLKIVIETAIMKESTLSWRWYLSYRNQSIDLLCKSMD